MTAQSPLIPAAALAATIFLVTIVLVIARPWRLSEASAAALGAVGMVLTGLVSPSGAVSDVAGHWNVLLFFVGLTGAAAVAERSGLIAEVGAWVLGRGCRDWVAWRAERPGRRWFRRRR